MNRIVQIFLYFTISSVLWSQTGFFDKDFLRNQDFIYQPNIRSVLIYKMGFEMSAPIIALNSDERLMLSFDDLSEDYTKYEYTVIHCDADWNNSDLQPNEYLETFTDDFIQTFEYSVNTMQDYVHYRQIIPNDVIKIKLSGNYIVKVYPSGQPDRPSFTRRFFVVDNKSNVLATVKSSNTVSERNYRHELKFAVNITGINLSDPQKEIKVTIRQNGRWDNAITNLKPWELRNGQLLFNDIGSYVFDAGNDFRYFDLKSLKYNSMRVNSIEYDPVRGYQVFLHDDEVRKKYLYTRIQESMNGRFLIKTEDYPNSDIESEYAMINFFLPYPNPLTDGKLYLMGGLTYWQFLRENELTYNHERKGFEASILLKQGYYNYQYIFLPNNSQVGDVSFIEGNFFETNNEYTFYVYYRPLGSRYDQLINVTLVLAHPN